MVWGLAFLTIFLIGAFIPPAPPPSVIVPETARGAADLLNLLIPPISPSPSTAISCPPWWCSPRSIRWRSRRCRRKPPSSKSMEVLRKASVVIWNWIVYVAPLGVFALFASTAGTVDAAVAGSLAVYTVLFLIGTVVLGFVILPFLLSRLVPQSYGAILAELRPALTLALVTTLSVAALPFIQKAAEELCRQEKIESEESGDVIKASLSIAYVLSQLGNYFIALFLIFASYHQRVALTVSGWVLLPLHDAALRHRLAERLGRRRRLPR